MHNFWKLHCHFILFTLFLSCIQQKVHYVANDKCYISSLKYQQNSFLPLSENIMKIKTMHKINTVYIILFNIIE